MEEINLEKFERLKNEKLVVIDFWASWCPPCLMFGPVFEKVSKEFSSKAKFYKCNVDLNSELARKFNVMSIPTVVFISKGKEIDRIMGFMPEDAFKIKLLDVLEKI